ncbi:putative methyl-accepting chemotaxis protein [Stenotrophomonas maltophilia K279a]|uniref:Methyl-accepting chemotaxis protein n=7 Tax=Gammaproteobacteria TaxID=1236 RepID=B2FIV7_STRMK|nr:putative methyl-accepting chemotaxis protein [Stenotrophomonas maltophilia K279a]
MQHGAHITHIMQRALVRCLPGAILGVAAAADGAAPVRPGQRRAQLPGETGIGMGAHVPVAHHVVDRCWRLQVEPIHRPPTIVGLGRQHEITLVVQALQQIAFVRRGLRLRIMQAQRHGRGQAAETGIHQPIVAVYVHAQQQVGTRGQFAVLGGQQYPRAQWLRIEAQCLQQRQQPAIEFEAVTTAALVEQLALHAVQVDRHRIAQQAAEGLEGQQCVVALLQQGQAGQGPRWRCIQLQALQVAGDIERRHGDTGRGRDVHCAPPTGVEVKRGGRVMPPSPAPGTKAASTSDGGDADEESAKVVLSQADTGASFRLESVMSAVVPHLRSLRTRLAALHSASPGLLRWLQPHRLSVANKLKATLWICGLGLVAIAAVYAWTGHANALAARSQASYQRGSDLAASLSTRVAEARRLQTQYARSFDDADRAQLLATQKALQTDLQALRAMPMDAGRRKALQALTEAADAFSQGVAALFERVDEMGRGDAGLAAQLQQAADTLQAQVDVQQRPALALSLQKMRRQEALLLLDGDSTHADRASEEKLPFDLALAGLPADVQDTLRTGMEAYQAALLGYTAARVGLDVEAQSLLDTATGVAPALAAFQQAQVAALARAQARQQAGARTMSVVFALTLLLVAGVLITSLVLVLRAVRQPIQDTLRFASDIADDRLDTTLRVYNANDEIGQLAQRLVDMQQRLRARIETERAVARGNTRVRQALDSAQAGLMVIDAEGLVAYANPALLEQLALRLEDLVGSDAVRLHPALASLAGVRQREEREIGHAGVRYQLIANAITDEGHFLGVAVEWRSRALETLLETEVAALVDAAAHGDLHGRIALEGKQGFVRTLSTSINRLLATFETNLGDLQALLAALARGDLSVRMEGELQGVFARMRDDANATVAQLGRIVTRIQQATSSLDTGVGEIVAGHHDLSQRTEQQAANLEETAASMHELTDTVGRNADAAGRADALVQGAAAVAQRGGEAVGQVVATMHGISEASRRIGDITQLIDGIAFQTNILALNAAVEAARAGEQGRSFAVVAAEVRLLAQRSAEAAKQIKGLIEDSVARVGQGNQQAEQAGITMGEIVGSVQQLAELLAGIRSASQDQHAGIAQVKQTIVQMEASTQRNASLVEEAGASTAQMQAQVHALTEAVGAFQLQSMPQARAAA